MRKVSVVCKEDQTSHSVPLSQGLIQIKALTVFSSVKAERGEKAVEEKYETSRGWFMKFKERCHFHSIEFQGEATNLNVEVPAIFQITLR